MEKRGVSAIAGVLAMRPQVILFDEPFSFLDYPGIQEVLKHMVHLHREGHTLIVTTHDVEKVIAHVDRIAIIHNGELKVAGPPEELYDETSSNLGSGLPVMRFSERKKFHGSNSFSLLSRKFFPSPLGCPMQGLRAPDHHPILSSIQSFIIHIELNNADRTFHPFPVSFKTIPP